MGFFDHLQQKGVGAIQAQKVQIRKVESRTPIQASPSAPKSKLLRPRSEPVSKPAVNPATSLTSKPKVSTSRKRYLSEQTFSTSSDDSDTDASLDFRIAKRSKTSLSVEPDLERCVRDRDAFSEQATSFSIVHAADVASLGAPAKFQSAFESEEKAVTVSLRYPGALQKEKYQLVVPHDNEGFKPLDDIVQVITIVSQHHVPETCRAPFEDEASGILRRLRRALVQGSAPKFIDAIEAYNKIIKRLRQDESISRHLDTTHVVALPLVERILTQVYSRTVSPRVESLRQYENGTDNVYGELLPRLISEIFANTRLKSNQVFVDLGSGVGNVVLQAALEVGCESWGCEMMQNACDLAELQEKEFISRCRLWGIAPGKTRLIRGDFLEAEGIASILRKADVVLINNQAFTPELNNKLVNYFLDMKEGCRIVSLKSFVPAGHRIQSRNLNSPINLLSVKKKHYWSDSVSWTNAGGTYFVATKDSSQLKAYLESMS
ncbi:Nucleosomal histone H3-Lys79 methylase [Ophidiomyces ophidiicola]|uniref:Nucleosomal histone H3-Lys79 methylase n=1 Tax=Ophidiomyces ophidiicola TaxID=1387563 RepID=A0ACB8UU13_9EURO|nr:Nucleosomal histone H3-Lys79 methylase [Ophidiomyces ophidiicola]KAI1946906.1 Nucleosomal histone H3-Lys79 methylase [Ophidiomyces ophidiicola]KAI1971547.1 Nucleosomal histone H3-Lys79 methylase [Ophidiomyces ophidiicola]KAI2009314.1 Nucleosomal histone H3-Lys79 methylase [Ophidiomyces ophidiicola]KAI2009985.1 Nucleosomal histone H3-Lys79 methylase [Ophidiomyces ophidiicola]